MLGSPTPHDSPRQSFFRQEQEKKKKKSEVSEFALRTWVMAWHRAGTVLVQSHTGSVITYRITQKPVFKNYRSLFGHITALLEQTLFETGALLVPYCGPYFLIDAELTVQVVAHS